MQGLGRPIISDESQGYTIVAVGSRIHWSKEWRTFHDFLFDYIKNVLGLAWGNAELAKNEQQQHPLLRWWRKICEFRKHHTSTGEIHTAKMTGVVRAYLGLAYDLYLSAHNAALPELLLKRLRNRDQFEGALYEAFVIGCFAKAGFDIDFENEDDGRTSHCEFTATHKETGRKFSVEAKAVTSASKRSGAATEPPKVRGHLVEALRKRAEHLRVVFIELSRAHSLGDDGLPEWSTHVADEIERCQTDITINGQPPPPAYVFVTNRSFIHDLDGTSIAEPFAVGGFNIRDFPPHRSASNLLEMHRARQRHIEIYWLTKTLETHREIPASFDERLPEELQGEISETRLQIGAVYALSDAEGRDVEGVLIEAAAMEPERKAWGVYRLQNGEHIMGATPLTDAELSAYRRSPETFFGAFKHVGGSAKSPLDAFDFIHDAYSKASREKLLEFMAEWPQIDQLRKLTQPDLAEYYAAAMGTSIWNSIEKRRTASK